MWQEAPTPTFLRLGLKPRFTHPRIPRRWLLSYSQASLSGGLIREPEPSGYSCPCFQDNTEEQQRLMVKAEDTSQYQARPSPLAPERPGAVNTGSWTTTPGVHQRVPCQETGDPVRRGGTAPELPSPALTPESCGYGCHQGGQAARGVRLVLPTSRGTSHKPEGDRSRGETAQGGASGLGHRGGPRSTAELWKPEAASSPEAHRTGRVAFLTLKPQGPGLHAPHPLGAPLHAPPALLLSSLATRPEKKTLRSLTQ